MPITRTGLPLLRDRTFYETSGVLGPPLGQKGERQDEPAREKRWDADERHDVARGMPHENEQQGADGSSDDYADRTPGGRRSALHASMVTRAGPRWRTFRRALHLVAVGASVRLCRLAAGAFLR